MPATAIVAAIKRRVFLLVLSGTGDNPVVAFGARDRARQPDLLVWWLFVDHVGALWGGEGEDAGLEGIGLLVRFENWGAGLMCPVANNPSRHWREYKSRSLFCVLHCEEKENKRTANSASRPSVLFSLSSSSANTSKLRYWSAISWYSASEICAALILPPLEGSEGSVFGGLGEEVSGWMPLVFGRVLENALAAQGLRKEGDGWQ